ncbi:MAG: DoxX family protein [Nevskia sp.]|nr:DoxX family protein [Nevskia sp.]
MTTLSVTNARGNSAANALFDSVKPYSSLLGRVLIAALFLVAGWTKLQGYAGTQAYMQAAGVPGGLLPLVLLVELGGGAAIVLGLFTRPVALLLAGFSIFTAVLFHSGADPVSQLMFLKNLGLAGGFLFLVANGAGRLSLDALRGRS